MAIVTTLYLRDWRDSETLFKHALASTTENNVAHFNEGIALKRQGRLDEADKHFLEAIRIKPGYSLSQIYAGLIRYETQRYDEAIEYYQKAIEYAAGSPKTAADAENNLAVVLQAQGKREEAVVHFRKAVQLNPNYADAHFNLGANLARLGRTDEAMAHFREALRIVPTHEYARKELERLAAAAPKAPMPSPGDQPPAPLPTNLQTAEEYYTAGNTLAQQSRFNEAAEHYKKAIQLRSDFTDARINLGNALAAQGKLREAAVEFRTVLKTAPRDVDTYINLGNVLSELGELGDAAAHYTKALEIDPNNTSACFSLGITQAKQGKLDKAAQSFARVVSIDPSNEAARDALKQVKDEIKRR